MLDTTLKSLIDELHQYCTGQLSNSCTTEITIDTEKYNANIIKEVKRKIEKEGYTIELCDKNLVVTPLIKHQWKQRYYKIMEEMINTMYNYCLAQIAIATEPNIIIELNKIKGKPKVWPHIVLAAVFQKIQNLGLNIEYSVDDREYNLLTDESVPWTEDELSGNFHVSLPRTAIKKLYKIHINKN